MSTVELRKILRELNRVDLERVEFSFLVQRLRAASKGTSIPLGPRPFSEFFYRARVANEEHLNLVRDLGAPPQELVQGYQRCNPPGQPMFYASSRRITALLEVNAQPGDIVYLGQWVGATDLPINQVLSPENFTESPRPSPTDEIFHTYLDTLFTRPIAATFANSYKMTAAAATILSTNFVADTAHGVHSDGTVGLRYSSIAHTHKGWNTAFHAHFARERLQLIHATRIKILARSGEDFRIQLLDTAIETIDGAVIWLANQTSIPIPQKDPRGTTFLSNGRSWILPCYDNPLDETELAIFLQG